MATIHVNRGTTSFGTFSEEDVRAGLSSGRFIGTDLGWREGMAGWLPLSKFPEFGGAALPPPLSPGQALPGKSRRPTSMTVISVLNFVFGGIQVLGALYVMNLNPLVLFFQNQAFRFQAILSLGVGVVAIIAGVGLIQVAPWGKGWTIAYAVLAIVSTVIGLLIAFAQADSKTVAERIGALIGALIGSAIGCTYPVVLLCFIRSAKWEEAFASRRPS